MKTTPLERIHTLLADFCRDFDIYTLEHLVCSFAETKLPDILNLAGVVGREQPALLKKIQQCRRDVFAHYQSNYFTSAAMTFGFSHQREALSVFKALPFHAMKLPARVDLLSKVCGMPVRDQGAKGTCSAHALVKAVEYKVKAQRPHSPAFIHYFAKQLDDDQQEGTSLQSVLEVARRFGSCEEQFAPYHELLMSNSKQPFQPNAFAIKAAVKHRLHDWFVARPCADLINLLKLMLAGGMSGAPRIPIIGVKVYREQFENLYTQLTGKRAKPLPAAEEPPYFLHALALVGMHDNPKYQGGGEALLVESYGEDYARLGEFGPGIGSVSYSYLVENLVAFGGYLQKGERETFLQSETELAGIQPAMSTSNQDLHHFSYRPMNNNHLGIFGTSGGGKTSLVCQMIEQAWQKHPDISWRIFDPHAEMASRLAHLAPVSLDVEDIGLPFPLLAHLRGKDPDTKVKNLSQDLRAAAPIMGEHQITELNRVLEAAITSGIKHNLELKQFLQDNLERKTLNHIEDFLYLLRSDRVVDQSKAGIFINDLSSLDEMPICRALYGICMLRYSKYLQYQNRSQPVMLVFDEAELLLEGKSYYSLKRFVQESRKFNMGSIFVAQVKPKQAWLIDNLSQVIELEGSNAMDGSLPLLINQTAMQQALYTKPFNSGKWWHTLTQSPILFR